MLHMHKTHNSNNSATKLFSGRFVYVELVFEATMRNLDAVGGKHTFPPHTFLAITRSHLVGFGPELDTTHVIPSLGFPYRSRTLFRGSKLKKAQNKNQQELGKTNQKYLF